MADVVNGWNRLEKQIRAVETNDPETITLRCRFEAPSETVAAPLWDSFCHALKANTTLRTLDLSRYVILSRPLSAARCTIRSVGSHP